MSAYAEAIYVIDEVGKKIDENSNAVKSIIVAHTDEASFVGKTVNAQYRWLTYTGVIDENGDVKIEVPYVGTYSLDVTDGEDTLKGFCQVLSIGGIYDGSLTGDVLFAFHYSELDSDPDTVNYPAGYDNSSWDDPAYMDFNDDEFHYGDWDPTGDHAQLLKWFFPKSCMLNFDTTVDYYLDENDESKKVDGTASGYNNVNGNNNAMMEWGQDGKKHYWKIVPDNDGLGFTFVVGNYKADDDMDCWNYYNCDGGVADHFYTAKYFGSLDSSNRLRSISGQSNSVSTTRTQENTYAENNNQTAKKLWGTEVYADWLFEGLMACLMAKSLHVQDKYGVGISGASAAVAPGALDKKGMFYGTNNGNDGKGVKVFGKEHPWGNLWRAIRGLINANGTLKVKLTYTMRDGSTGNGYNETGSGYISAGSAPGAGGSISSMFKNKKYLLPKAASGSGTTYYCDYVYVNNSQVDYAIVGGVWTAGAYCGVFCVNVSTLASAAATGIGAALSCKPLAA